MAAKPRRKPRKKWGQLSKRSRERASAEAAQRWGLTRRQARERYNRGTYKPFAKEKVKRVPEDVVKHPEKYPGLIGDKFLGGELDREQLEDAAYRNFRAKIGEYFKFNRFRILHALSQMSNAALIRIAGASEDEITAWAAYQEKSKAPRWLQSLGWTDSDGKWHNPFWYH